MYAIIETGGKQYKVSEGDVIRVEKLDAEPGKEVTFDKVILIGGDAVKTGKELSNASVSATVLTQGKDRKVVVYRYKPKTGYHKKNGHRQPFTAVKINRIQA